MSFAQTMRFAKKGVLSKSELYNRMLEAAKVFQTVGVSEAQAFTKFIATDEGAELFRIHGSLPGPDYKPAWQAPINKNAGDNSLWDRLVRATAKSQGITYSKAVDACLSTPEGRAVFDEQRRHELIHKSGFTVADMECFTQAQALVEKRRGDPVNPLPSEYEVACNNIRQNYPHLTESEVHDEARKANPDAWEQHKTMKLGGGKPLPRGHVKPEPAYPTEPTSQRTPTPRPPQWQSDHSGNRPGNTPQRSPHRPDGSPQVKRSGPAIRGWWDSHTPAAQDDLVRIVSKSSGLSDEAARRVLEHM
jgi:hypothetical protein